MSIALERGFPRGPAYEPPPGRTAAGRCVVEPASSSSSIGKDSDGSAVAEVEEGEEEVASECKEALDSLEALEESLPMKRGISNFYSGKSKSFTSLADVMSSSASAKDLGKPENPYTRKRKNLLVYKNLWEKPHHGHLGHFSSIPKRPASSTRNTLVLSTLAMSNSGGNGNSSGEEHDEIPHLPPLHPPVTITGDSSSQRSPFQMRSFSLMDLQGMACSCFSVGSGDNKHKRFY